MRDAQALVSRLNSAITAGTCPDGEIPRQAPGSPPARVRTAGLRPWLAALVLSLAAGCGDQEPNRPESAAAAAPGPVEVNAPPAAANVTTAPVPPPKPASAPEPPEWMRKSRAETFGPAASRSRLVVIGRPGAGQGQDRGAVALSAPVFDDNAGHNAYFKNGILARELIRQAMLIAARDELGLATRDEILGESLPAPAGGPALELGSFMMSPNGTLLVNHAFVTRGEGAKAERLLTVDLPCPYSPAGSLAKLAEKAEAMSRTEFPGVLRKLGAAGKANAIRADAAVPAGVEDRLSQFGFPGLFAAIRTVHEAIRTDGESPERLGALAQGYALLGVLSDFHWHPAHKAYKARALLYAERRVARTPKDARALWQRAYVRALVGMHRDALADLAAAGAASAAGNPPAQPDWTPLIEALAHQDTRRLGAAEGPRARLGALLNLVALEHPTGSWQVLNAARRVAEIDPECFRAYDAMCRVPGVANGHTATTLGLEAYARLLPPSLKAMPGLPARVRAFLDHPDGGDPALYEAFEKSAAPGDDAGEPSWSAMGHLLRETRFLLVYRRLRFMKTDWGVPFAEFWNESRASVVGHRFYPFLEMIGTTPSGQFRPNPEFFGRLLRLDLELNEVTMFLYLQKSRDRNVMKAMYVTELQLDEAARDLGAEIQFATPDMKVLAARRLLEISPDCPYAMAALVEHDKKATAAEIAGWEKKAGDSLVFLEAMARVHTEKNQPELAEKDLIRYIKQQPQGWVYQMLADNYRARGDMKRWRATLEESLTTEETGLEHTQNRVQIADYLMDQGKWAEAKEYAETAGESWAGWAMICAQRCAEGMKDWPRAELWARRLSERYAADPSALLHWSLFCVKTGRGNLRAARQFAEQGIRNLGGLENLNPDLRGYYQWIKGDLRAALGSFQEAYAQAPSFAICLPAIAVAERLGDRAAVEPYRKLLMEKHRAAATQLTGVLELVFQALDAAKSGPPDLKAANQALEKTHKQVRPHAEFWTGILLDARGQAAAAKPYLERSVAAPGISEWHHTIAGQALRRGRR
ncbi:MAG: tetratricopeptide repeat protein [Isosphaeraceae bacterium]